MSGAREKFDLPVVDPSADLGVFVYGPNGAPHIDRWMPATEVEKLFGIPVARIYQLADDDTLLALRVPRGGRLQGSHAQIWRASAVAAWFVRDGAIPM